MNEIAFRVMQEATGELPPAPPEEKNPAAGVGGLDSASRDEGPLWRIVISEVR